MKKILILFIGLNFIFNVSTFGQTWQPNISNLLGSKQVTCMYEDFYFNIWIGTSNNGVFKYDGFSWVNYTTADGLSSNKITCIAEGDGNIIWIGTADAGISYYDGFSWLSYSTLDGLSSDVVYSMSDDVWGNMWVGTATGVSHFDGLAWTNYATAQSVNLTNVKCVMEDYSMDMWFGTSNGLVKYDGTNWFVYTTSDGLPTNVVNSLYVDSKGIMWMGTAAGAVFKKYNTFVTLNTTNSSIPSNTVNSFMEDYSGTIWMATQNGVAKYADHHFVNSGTANGLNHAACSSFLLVYPTTLWVGTQAGAATTQLPAVSGPTADFSFSFNLSTLTLTLTNSSTSATDYFWDMGNGMLNLNQSPVFQYDLGGYYRMEQYALDMTTNTIAVNEQLMMFEDGTPDCEADIEYSISPTGKTVYFTSTSVGSGILATTWDFGDNISVVSNNPTHTYVGDNTYNVCLTVSTSKCKNMSCDEVRLGNTPLSPFAAFIYVTDKETNTVYFNDKSKDATAWVWDFGDGLTSTLKNPVHTYADTGLYKVILEVTNASGKKDFHTNLIHVHSLVKTLKANFIAYDEDGKPLKGLPPIQFKGDGYGDAAEVEWDFGDGQENKTSTSPTHQYQQEGTYHVCMTVKDSLSKQSDTKCENVEVVVTGIQNEKLTIKNEEWSMYPNPIQSKVESLTLRQAQGENNVNVSSSSPKGVSRTNSHLDTFRQVETLDVTISNSLGQEVFNSSFFISHSSLKIDVSQFENGIYYVRIGDTIKKLVITK